MSKLTITEALAEIPTINKRIEKKQTFIENYLFRQSAIRDPHEKDGGSAVLIASELQSINDLQNRLVMIRAKIQKANQETNITINDKTKTIADWLTWRREVSEQQRHLYNSLSAKLNAARQDAMRKGLAISDKDSGYSADYVININEKDLADKIEDLENTLGVLDGQLSLKNATTMIDLP